MDLTSFADPTHFSGTQESKGQERTYTPSGPHTEPEENDDISERTQRTDLGGTEVSERSLDTSPWVGVSSGERQPTTLSVSGFKGPGPYLTRFREDQSLQRQTVPFPVWTSYVRTLSGLQVPRVKDLPRTLDDRETEGYPTNLSENSSVLGSPSLLQFPHRTLPVPSGTSPFTHPVGSPGFETSVCRDLKIRSPRPLETLRRADGEPTLEGLPSLGEK